MKTKAVAVTLVLVQPWQADTQGVEEWNVHGIENRYISLGAGPASVGYPEGLEELLDFMEHQPGIDRTTLTLHGGYYEPQGRKSLVGGSGYLTGDIFEFDLDLGEVAIYSVFVSLSGIHFLQYEIGRGVFLKGDIGIARMTADLDIGAFGLGIEEQASSDVGAGFGAGIGYAIPVFRGTRVTMLGHYALLRVEGDVYESLTLTVNGLF